MSKVMDSNSVLYWRGKQIANFSHKRLRDKIDTEEPAHIEKLARMLVLKWQELSLIPLVTRFSHGEFKVYPKTGKFWFIEVNPRMWGSISLQ